MSKLKSLILLLFLLISELSFCNITICTWNYSILLRELGKEKGMLGQIFTKSQNNIQDPAKLYKLVDLIDKENWVMMGADVKGDIYEGLLEKNAEDTKSGAGQYFTPRSLIRAMVECVRPEPMRTYYCISGLSRFIFSGLEF